jgi:thioredoxin reductase (NADPH)
VTSVDFSKPPFKVVVGKDVYYSKSIIVSTGASARYLGLPSEMRLRGRGVSACATCDGAFFRNQKVAVVGGGDTAMEEASFLTRFATKVWIIHRRDSFRASKIMVDRVLRNPKIEVIYNSELKEVLGDNSVTGVRIFNALTNETHEMPMDGVFLAIGHRPNTEIFKGQLQMNEMGYLVTKGKSTFTSVDGIFASGDVQDHVYRQAITAAGSGCMAAIDCERWLEQNDH